MKFRIQGNELADSASKIGQTLAMLPMMREQWAQDANQKQAKNALLGAQMQSERAQANHYSAKTREIDEGIKALGFENRFTNAANAYGVTPADVPDFLNFAKTKQMPGQYVQPPPELGGGPSLPTPAMYGDDTLSKVLRMAAMTGNAGALGDKNSSHITGSLLNMQDQDLVAEALGMAKRGDNMGMSAINTIRGKKEFTPFKAVGNTGTALNEITGSQPISNQALNILFNNEGLSRTDENKAQATQARAAAGASGALAGLRSVQTGNAKIQGGILAQDLADVLEGNAPTSKQKPSRATDSTNAKLENGIYDAMMKSPQWANATDAEFSAEMQRRQNLTPSAQGKPKAAETKPTKMPDGYTPNKAIEEAKRAIAAGANKTNVIQRLKDLGIDPKGL